MLNTDNAEKLRREAEVRAMVGGICRMTLWRWIGAGKFPKPVIINNRRFWRESALVAWQRQLAEVA